MNIKNEIVSGNLYRAMVYFALPFLVANFVQTLYGVVDMLVVGWFSDTANISAVANGTQVTQLLLSLITGLTLGSTILIAQYIGAQKEKDIEETIATTMTIFMMIAIVLTVIMFIFTPMILQVLNVPTEAYSASMDYVLICSAGIISIFGYNAISAILRGMGDSKRPLYFITIACISNIILDLILVGGFHMGAAGAAIATVGSQTISLILSIVYLRRKEFAFDFKRKSFKLNRKKAALILKTGIPVSLQETITSLSFLFIASIVNGIGVAASAATGISAKFEGFAMLPATALSGAISTIAAQNIGAQKPERAQEALSISFKFAVSISIIFFIWGHFFPESIMKLFTSDAEVIIAGAQYLKYFSVDFILVAFGFTLTGFFNGCGCTVFAMINSVAASIFIRIPLTYIFSIIFPSDLTGIGAAAPIATLISVIIGFIYFFKGRWKEQNIVSV